MTPTTHEARRLTHERRCWICRRQLPEGRAVLWTRYRVLTCAGACCRVFKSATRDFSRSRRGRLRSVRETLAAVPRVVRPPPMVGLLSCTPGGRA